MIVTVITLFMQNIPTILFVVAVLIAALHRGIPDAAERFLSWILLASGLDGLWAGLTHVFFPETAARFIGWQVSPFQFEIGIADIAIGVTSVIAFWRPLAFKAATVTFLVIFYVGLVVGHLHQLMATGDTSPGNAGALLALTILRPMLLAALLLAAGRPGHRLVRP